MSASLKVSVADWPSLAIVTLVAPTFSDHSMFDMLNPSTGAMVVRYFLKFLSVLEAMVTKSPSFARAAFATKRSFAKFGAVAGGATAVATANGERSIIT